ncbi:MAG: hypothetical protein ABMB14_15605, partial [Myxococcota bacterium]
MIFTRAPPVAVVAGFAGAAGASAGAAAPDGAGVVAGFAVDPDGVVVEPVEVEPVEPDGAPDTVGAGVGTAGLAAPVGAEVEPVPAVAPVGVPSAEVGAAALATPDAAGGPPTGVTVT